MLDRVQKISRELSPGLRKIIGNVGWLFAERLLMMIVNFLVSVYVIRYLGAGNFGKLSYSLSLVIIFSAIANLGLNGIVVREVVREEKNAPEILGTAFVLKLIASLATIALIALSIVLFTNQPDTRSMTVVISIGLVFSAFDVIEFWFESQVLSRVTAILRTMQTILSSIVKFILIAGHLPPIAFAWLVLGENTFKALAMSVAYIRHDQSLRKWRVNWSKGWEMLQDSWPLLLSTGMILIYMKIDQVMLGNMSTVSAVGNYAAAVRFSEVWYFIPIAICSSLFPSIFRSKQRSDREYYSRLQILYDLMAWFAFSIAIPMTFLSTPLMVTLLGPTYVESGEILTFHIWSGLFVFLGHAQHQWLMAENINQFSLAKTSLGALSNILLNFWLIPHYQGVGAAIATTVSYFIYSHISCLLFPQLRANGWMLTKALFIPFRISQNIQYFNTIKKVIVKA
ncbi:flippase [Pannus brasiliensis CCIBt3594]|uniref:Flippase n=1 Tax=Pannus brasiliensis CCIBt3594 TaxID=1427578 RepID=A0AAW9QX54_9CHRO